MTITFGDLNIGDVYCVSDSVDQFVKIAENSSLDETRQTLLSKRFPNCLNLENKKYCVMSNKMPIKYVVKYRTDQRWLGPEVGDD